MITITLSIDKTELFMAKELLNVKADFIFYRDANCTKSCYGEGRGNYSVTRRDQRKVISRSTTPSGQREAYTYTGLAPEVKGRHMEPLIVDLKEIPDTQRSSHSGEEFI